MRRLITVLASLAVVSMLVPSIGLAIEPPVDQGVGVLCIYTDEDLTAANNFLADATPFVQHRVYFVLYNAQGGFSSLGAMTFSWSFSPAPASAPIATLFIPSGAVNIGSTYNLLMGFGTPVVLTDNHALVLAADVMFLGALAEPTYIYLGPATPTSIPGQMEYNDYYNPANVLPAHPNSVDGLYENPVFGFGTAVATEGATWGGVKSLFR
jgi:hypothetical protein